jgi:GTP-binding protein HflX
MVADTVGFINKIPHSLIEAFKSTLEEVWSADLLLHLVDMTHPLYEAQIDVVASVLRDIGAGETPYLMVPNKIDLAPSMPYRRLMENGARGVCPISALTGKGIPQLLEMLAKMLDEGKEQRRFCFSPSQGHLLALLRQRGRILEEHYVESGIEVTALITPKLAGQMRKLLQSGNEIEE